MRSMADCRGAAHLGELVEDGVCGQLLELFLLGGELLIDLVSPPVRNFVPLRRVAERLVDGLLHAVELLVDAVKRINHLRQLRVFGQELRGRADGALAGLEDVADVVDDDPGAADQVPPPDRTGTAATGAWR